MLGDFDAVDTAGVVVDVDRREPSAGVGVTYLTLRATDRLDGIGNGWFAQPTGGVRWESARFDADIEFLGFAFTQFALPVTATSILDFDFTPAASLQSPAVVAPLVARTAEGVALLAPIDRFHEQIIAVETDALRWGWHGDLDEVPAGFATTLGVFVGASLSDVLHRWRADLAGDTDIDRPVDNPLSTHLSYWTDNGAAYWYRTEADRTIAESVVDVVERLRSDDVPIRAVELDSWFYPHDTLRPITEIGYPEEVPPSGMSTWSARADAFPATTGDAVLELSDRLDRPPLVLHARHISPSSPYVTGTDEWWVEDFGAQPIDPAFFRRWFDDAARWGATVIEQDWMLMYWFGVRALRSSPGRAADWQRALNDHARATSVDLLWCMSTPADMMQAASLDRVVALRTCDDYRFAEDPAFLWTWFLTVNRLANTLGLPAFKDCFFSNPDLSPTDDAIDGDPHAEVEALLSALSGGPVGIGDRIGRTNLGIVMRCCDDDGRLRRVDQAVAATDDSLFGAPERGERLMWATTTATTAEGVWTYVVAINTTVDTATGTVGAEALRDRFELDGEEIVYEWRTGASATRTAITAELVPRDWALFVVCPTAVDEPGESFDPTKYVIVESGATASS
ncbi:Sip1-related alpha-galactosidase [Ilumatobacter nonamiensis]|uniref:Sip1-related alpha-galactosidase n=1 Tax=Ilumatobacter nonamiensis TaxID=467093 RepID=UPI00034C11BA|nr:Sip1-related alpha-galactosidase [Ilumatobacter nonamiensis]